MFKEGQEYEITSKKLSRSVIGVLEKNILGVLVVQGTETEGVFGIKTEDIICYREMPGVE